LVPAVVDGESDLLASLAREEDGAAPLREASAAGTVAAPITTAGPLGRQRTVSDRSGSDNPAVAGHRLVPHTADCIIEAWGPDRVSCLTEALCALLEGFAEVPDAAAPAVFPLAAEPGGAEDMLVSLFEEVIYALDVFSLVPVRFHLTETEDGGVAGDMEVVSVDQVVVVGPAPKAVSYHGLSMESHGGGWRCHVLVDV